MNPYTTFRIALLTCLLALYACHEDRDEIIDQVFNPDPPRVIVSAGVVTFLDQAGLVGPGTMQIFDDQVVAFKDWAFQYGKGTQVDRDYELLRLTTPDRLEFLQAASLRENDVNYVHWSVPEITTFAGQAEADAGFSHPSGVNVNVKGGGLLLPSGDAYVGPYTLSLAVIGTRLPEAAAIPSFNAFNDAEGPVSLLMRACYYVAFQTPGGDELLPDSSRVWLEVPGGSPATDWYFDPDRARWHPLPAGEYADGIELKKNGYYTRAESRPLVRRTGMLRVNQEPVPHYPIVVSYEGLERRIFTTGAGLWQIHLPADTRIDVKVDLPCDGTRTFALDTDSQREEDWPLDVTSAIVSNVPIEGTIRDCAAQNVVPGFLSLDGDASSVIYGGGEALDFHWPVCAGGAVEVQAVDLGSGESGPETLWPVMDTVRLGSVFACEQAKEEYLRLSVDDHQAMYWELKSSVTPKSRLLIEEDAPGSPQIFRLWISGFSTGDYPDTGLNIEFEDTQLGGTGYSLYCPTSTSGCGFETFTITHYPEVAGGWIKGYFKGEFWIQTFNPLTAGKRTVVCEFQVYRDY